MTAEPEGARWVLLSIVAERHFEGLTADGLRTMLPDRLIGRFGRRWFVDYEPFKAWLETHRGDPVAREAVFIATFGRLTKERVAP